MYITISQAASWLDCSKEYVARGFEQPTLTPEEILDCDLRPEERVQLIIRSGFYSERLIRLFAYRCARYTPLPDGEPLWTVLPGWAREPLLTAEYYANGEATKTELIAAHGIITRMTWATRNWPTEGGPERLACEAAGAATAVEQSLFGNTYRYALYAVGRAPHGNEFPTRDSACSWQLNELRQVLKEA
jgi:hypothetical protein